MRVSAVFEAPGGWAATYDGRATAAENWEERTGLACRPGGPASSPRSARAGRGVAARGRAGCATVGVVALPDGGYRLYYEATRADGAHDLRTELIASPPAADGAAELTEDLVGV